MFRGIFAFALVLLPVIAHAKEESIDVKLSTLGVVIDKSWRHSENVNYRISFSQSVNALNGAGDTLARGGQSVGQIWSYTYDYKQQTLGWLVDMMPFHGNFRTSIGLFINHSKTGARADASCSLYGIGVPCTYSVGGNLYQASQISQPQGSLKYRLIAPFVGIGWGNASAKDKTWTFAWDAGLLYQGKPTVTLDATGNVAGLQNDLAVERAQLRADAPAWYPVISLGIGYNW